MIDWTKLIEFNPEKLFSKPLIINTRIPVDLILEKPDLSDSVEELMEAYPKINRDDNAACLLFAAKAKKYR